MPISTRRAKAHARTYSIAALAIVGNAPYTCRQICGATMITIRRIPEASAHSDTYRRPKFGLIFLAIALFAFAVISYIFPDVILIFLLLPAFVFDPVFLNVEYPWYIDIPLSAAVTTLSTA